VDPELRADEADIFWLPVGAARNACGESCRFCGLMDILLPCQD